MKRSHRKLARALAPHGIEITQRRNGHLRADHPDGRTVYMSATPSDRRSADRIRRDLRRTFGIDIDVRSCT